MIKKSIFCLLILANGSLFGMYHIPQSYQSIKKISPKLIQAYPKSHLLNHQPKRHDYNNNQTYAHNKACLNNTLPPLLPLFAITLFGILSNDNSNINEAQPRLSIEEQQWLYIKQEILALLTEAQLEQECELLEKIMQELHNNINTEAAFYTIRSTREFFKDRQEKINQHSANPETHKINHIFCKESELEYLIANAPSAEKVVGQILLVLLRKIDECPLHCKLFSDNFWNSYPAQFSAQTIKQVICDPALTSYVDMQLSDCFYQHTPGSVELLNILSQKIDLRHDLDLDLKEARISSHEYLLSEKTLKKNRVLIEDTIFAYYLIEVLQKADTLNLPNPICSPNFLLKLLGQFTPQAKTLFFEAPLSLKQNVELCRIVRSIRGSIPEENCPLSCYTEPLLHTINEKSVAVHLLQKKITKEMENQKLQSKQQSNLNEEYKK